VVNALEEEMTEKDWQPSEADRDNWLNKKNKEDDIFEKLRQIGAGVPDEVWEQIEADRRAEADLRAEVKLLREEIKYWKSFVSISVLRDFPFKKEEKDAKTG
jgi:hypothetical protein